MAFKTLHGIVNEFQEKQKNSADKKRLVGYTVGAYTGILEHLEKAGLIQQSEDKSGSPIAGNQPQITVESRSWSALEHKDLNTKNETITNGFYNNDMQQVEVKFNPYMTFFVDVK